MIYLYFFLVLFLTELIECTVIYCIYRSKQFVYCVFLCNLITNPALNLITIEIGNLFGRNCYNIALAVCEICAAVIESGIIHRMCCLNWKKALFLSILLNITSFGLGLIILKFL